MRELKATQQWDDKFGIIDKRCGFQTEDKQCGYVMPDSMVGCIKVGNETSCTAYIPKEMKPLVRPEENDALDLKIKMNQFGIGEPRKVIIDGVGADAEVITNSRGGKQSKSPMAMHLLDPNFLIDFAKNKAEELEYEDEGKSTCVDGEDIDKYRCYKAMEFIGNFMLLDDKMFLQYAMDELNCEELQQIISIAKVLQFGASRYKANNWRLIPQEEHINHALIYIVAHLAGDTQDEHIDHALCRLMMAYATEVSDGFDYCTFVDKRVA